MNFAKIAFSPLQRAYQRVSKKLFAYRDRHAEFGAYRRWLTQHDGGSYKQFYVDTIQGHLFGEGGRHSTLGPHPIWQQRGDAILHRLIALGLRSDDVVVDYGCGTLREGVHLIRWLAKGRYIGLDIDERILDAGRRLAGPELLVGKWPRLALVNPATLAEAGAANPAWIVSSYVISQMPSEELDAYFDNLAILMQRGGKAALQLRLSWRTKQYARTGWYHNRGEVAKRLAKRGLKVLQMRTRKLISRPYRVRGDDARPIVGSGSSLAGKTGSLPLPDVTAARRGQSVVWGDRRALLKPTIG